MQVSSTLAKVTIVIGLLLISIVFLYFISPIPQWNSYHQFADSRALFFINNFGDVASNVGFFAVGFYGLVTVLFHVFIKDNLTKISPIPPLKSSGSVLSLSSHNSFVSCKDSLSIGSCNTA